MEKCLHSNVIYIPSHTERHSKLENDVFHLISQEVSFLKEKKGQLSRKIMCKETDGSWRRKYKGFLNIQTDT